MFKSGTIITVEQGSNDWHALRNNAVGASDYPTLAYHAGLCKHNLYRKSINAVINEKLRKPKGDNSFFRMGRIGEKEQLDKIRRKYPDVVAGLVVQYNDNPRIIASLDAYVPSGNFIIETKRTSKSIFQQKIMHEYYQFQCYHQMIVTGIPKTQLSIEFYNKFTEEVDDWLSSEVYLKDVDIEQHLKICDDFLIQFDAQKLIYLERETCIK